MPQNKTEAPPSPQPTSGSGESPTVSMAQADQAGRMGWLSVGLAAVGAYVVYSLSAATQSATSIQFAIIAFFVFLGLLAVRQAWTGIRAESKAFEANREKELDKKLIERLVKKDYPSAPQLRASDSFFTTMLHSAPPTLRHGVRWHHCERLHAILKAAFPDGKPVANFPSLSNLSLLTQAAEQSRRSVWILNTITSTLLIVGILGTLYGVHEALPESVEQRIDMVQVKAALLPSAIAVACTIVLIILRAFYRHAVNRHLGRLDRHTLRIYFPLFRQDEISEQRFKQLANEVAELNSCLASIDVSVSKLESSSGGSRRHFRNLLPVAQKLDKLRRYIEQKANHPELRVDMEQALLNQATEFSTWYHKLHECVNALNTQVLASSTPIEQNRKLCERCNQTMENVKLQWPILCDIAEKMLPDATQIRQVQQNAALLSSPIKDIAKIGIELNEEEKQVVEQAVISTDVAGTISNNLEQYRDTLESNGKKYADYRDALVKSYEQSSGWLQDGTTHIHEQAMGIVNMHRKLKIRDERRDTEPYIRVGEAILLCSILILFVVNIYLTF